MEPYRLSFGMEQSDTGTNRNFLVRWRCTVALYGFTVNHENQERGNTIANRKWDTIRLLPSNELDIEGEQLSVPELPRFNFNCVVVATNNFPKESKLGQRFRLSIQGKVKCS